MTLLHPCLVATMAPLNCRPQSQTPRKAALGTWLLVVLTGCHVPPVPPAGTSGPRAVPRDAALVCQVVSDTAVQGAARPLATGCRAAGDTGALLENAANELVRKRVAVALCGPCAPVAPDRPALDPTRLEQVLERLTGRTLRPALLQVDLSGEEALVHLESLIDSATETIDVLMYQWDSDLLAWAVAQRLAARAACLGPAPDGGASVRVLVDGAGTLIHAPDEKKTAAQVNAALAWLSCQPNVRVLRTRNGLAHFDHRKLVVLDGRIAWSGGRNFTVASFFEYHDLSYTLRGPLAAEMAARFEATWEEFGGPPRVLPPAPLPCPDETNAWARVVGTGPKERDFARTLSHAVDSACHHVYLENPYFTDAGLLLRLAKARKRGADVRVVIARDSQSRVIDRVMQVLTNRMLKLGVRVYRYPGKTHMKAASVDGRWAYIGTGNFDSLSLQRNNEVGLAIAAGPFIAELEERVFLADMRPEWEVTAPVAVNLGDYLCEILAGLVF